jgi:hypothetical protein
LSPAVLLTSAPFLLAVALLLLNDWALKAAFGNWLTGKLSDFAGLFAFSLFATAMAPRHRDSVFVLTAAGFALWKSPLSDAPLAAWNALGLWPLGRVIDYTDLAALGALVPAYWMTRRPVATTSILAPSLRRRVVAVGSVGLSLIAFTATSVAAPRYELHDATSYRVTAPPAQVRAGLTAIGLYVADPTRSTPVVYIRQPPERVLGVTIELREADSAETVIRLLDVSTAGPEPRKESLERAFLAQVIEPLRQWLAQSRQ